MMHKKFGICWLEYKGPFDLTYHPSNMKVGLCWYQKRTNNKWAYNLVDHLILFW